MKRKNGFYTLKEILIAVGIAFIAIVAIGNLVSCSCIPIVGDHYVVTSVEKYCSMGRDYKVTIESCDPSARSKTFNGNVFTLQTNHLYTVGDTITIR